MSLKPDPAYIKRLLTAFESSPSPWTDIRELTQQDPAIEADDDFAFHLALLGDSGLVVGSSDPSQLGIGLSGDRDPYVSVVPLRLTQQGHDLAMALSLPATSTRVMKTIAETGLSAATQVVATLLTQMAQNGLGGAG
jgi:hypothetical protein